MSGKFTIRQARPPVIAGSVNVKTAQISTAKIENIEGNALSGLNSWKGSVRVCSTSNVTTLSGSVVVDGITLIENDTVLLKNQSTGSENGIWLVTNNAWTRNENLIAGSNAAGIAVFVNEGTTNSDTIWVCTDDEANAVVGTSSLTFSTITSLIGAAGSDTQVQFNSSGALAGDTGLTYVSGSGTLTATVLTDGTATLSSGALSGATTVTASGAVTGGSLTDGTATLSSGALSGATTVTASGAVTGGSLTDGTATLSSGALSGATTVTASGAVTGGSLTDGTATLSSGALSGATTVTASGAVTGGSLTDGTATLSSGALSGATTVTASGAVTGGSLTDGTATLSSGALSGATTVTASGAITGGSLTDGTATLSSGALSGATTVTASGAITGGSLTDGTATLSSGALSGATTGSFSGNVDATGGLDINADNVALTVGAGTDFSISHDATNTTMTSATGDLIIDNTLATGSTINRLGTDTSATDFQVQNNSASALFTVDGSGAVTTTGVVTTPGVTTSGKTTVTQLTNINTAVTSNTLSGVITTVTATNSGQASETFTVNCSACTSASIILTNVLGYSGTYDTNGHPDTVVDDVANGSFKIVVVNNDNAALNGVLNIGYMVI